MKLRERLVVALLVWLGVYPAVLISNYVLRALGLTDLPLPVTVLMTTAITVPVIEFLVVPAVKKVVAKAEERAGIEGGLRDD